MVFRIVCFAAEQPEKALFGNNARDGLDGITSLENWYKLGVISHTPNEMTSA